MKRPIINDIVRLGKYEFQMDPPLLKRELEEISLPAKQLETLKLLLQKNGESVSKDEFFQTVWHGDFVEEGNLSQTVFLLRRTLGKLEQGGEYIETVPRIGYRISPAALAVPPVPTLPHLVSQPDADPECKSSPPAAVRIERRAGVPFGRRRADQSLYAIALLIGISAFGLLVLAIRLNLRRPLLLHSVSVTGDGHAKANSARLILDGSRLFFTELIGSKSYLAEAAIAGSSVERNLAPLPSSRASGLTPDRDGIVFTSSWEGLSEPSLYSMTLHGQATRSLSSTNVHDAEWSPNGQTLAMASGHQIQLLDAKTGKSQVIANLPDVPFWLAWSPDGSRIRFTREQGGARRSLWEVQAWGGEVRPLLAGSPQENRVCCGSWSPDGKYFVYVFHEGQKSSLWIRREAKGASLLESLLGSQREYELAAGPVTYWHSPLMAADGSVYAVGEYARGETVTLHPGSVAAYEALPGGLSADTVAYSHDGQWMAYVLYPEGTLWRSRIDGSEKTELTNPGQNALFPQWAPDDRHLTFLAGTDGQKRTLQEISPGGGEARTLVDDGGTPDAASFSPEGDRIALSESIDFGVPSAARQVIRILDLKSGKIMTIKGSEGLWKARWSPDGRFLAALSANRKNVMLYCFETQSWSTLAELPVNDLIWSKDGESLYFDTADGASPVLYKLPLATGKPQAFTSLAGISQTGINGSHLSISHGGEIQILRNIGISEVYRLTLSTP